MPRYDVIGTDPTGKPVQFQTDDLPDPQSEHAFFAPLLQQGYNITGAKPLAAPAPQATPSTSPPAYAAGMGTTAPPTEAPTLQPPTPEEVSQNRRRAGMIGLTSLAAGAAAPLAEATGLIGATANLGRLAGPLARTGIRALTSAATAAPAGALSSIFYPEGGSATEQATTQAALGAGGSILGDLASGATSTIANFIKSRVGATLTTTQQAALDAAAQQAAQENRPFDLVGYVQNAPEFAGTAVRARITRMSQLGGDTLAEAQGVPEVRYAQQQAGQALEAMGGPLTPHAQGASPGFGQDARAIIDEARGRLQQQARETAQATTKKVSPAVGPSVRKSMQETIGNLSLPPEEAALRMQNAARIPQERALARESASRQYQAALGDETAKAFKTRLAQIKDETGINLDGITQEQLAAKLRGANVGQVVALTKHVPELAPAVARSELTNALEAAGGNPATDSFDFRAFAKKIRAVGEHNMDAIYGPNADPMRKLLTTLDSFSSGRALVAKRLGEQTPKPDKPQWQPIAAVLAPVARVLSGANPLGLGTALGGGGGALFGATTATMTGSPSFYTALLTNPNTLKTFTNLVDEAGRTTLTPLTTRSYILRFLRDFGVQSGVRLLSTPTPDQPPPDFLTAGYPAPR